MKSRGLLPRAINIRFIVLLWFSVFWIVCGFSIEKEGKMLHTYDPQPKQNFPNGKNNKSRTRLYLSESYERKKNCFFTMLEKRQRKTEKKITTNGRSKRLTVAIWKPHTSQTWRISLYFTSVLIFMNRMDVSSLCILFVFVFQCIHYELELWSKE